MGVTLYNLIIVTNCDMRYLSKDKASLHQSSMSKNFYHRSHYLFLFVSCSLAMNRGVGNNRGTCHM